MSNSAISLTGATTLQLPNCPAPVRGPETLLGLNTVIGCPEISYPEFGLKITNIHILSFLELTLVYQFSLSGPVRFRISR